MVPKLLIVEDNELNLELLLSVVEGIAVPVTILTARDGGQGWQLFKEEKPSIILLDMHLPEIDGFTLARKVKMVAPDTIIVGLTALAMVGDKERVLDAGCDYYRSKPIKVKEFRDFLGTILGLGGSA
mgnify:CR=1 FL=1